LSIFHIWNLHSCNLPCSRRLPPLCLPFPLPSRSVALEAAAAAAAAEAVVAVTAAEAAAGAAGQGFSGT
ncbi:hypothetical protein CLOP_g7435, partial [Closterium sp. NIES-67]